MFLCLFFKIILHQFRIQVFYTNLHIKWELRLSMLCHLLHLNPVLNPLNRHKLVKNLLAPIMTSHGSPQSHHALKQGYHGQHGLEQGLTSMIPDLAASNIHNLVSRNHTMAQSQGMPIHVIFWRLRLLPLQVHNLWMTQFLGKMIYLQKTVVVLVINKFKLIHDPHVLCPLVQEHRQHIFLQRFLKSTKCLPGITMVKILQIVVLIIKRGIICTHNILSHASLLGSVDLLLSSLIMSYYFEKKMSLHC